MTKFKTNIKKQLNGTPYSRINRQQQKLWNLITSWSDCHHHLIYRVFGIFLNKVRPFGWRPDNIFQFTPKYRKSKK